MGNFSAAEILTIYGLTLMICGALAFQDSGLAKNAVSAIYMGNGGAVISFLLAAGTRNLELKKGERGYKIMMISIHLAFIFPLLFGSVIGWRLLSAWNNPHKAYLKPYFSVIIAMSLLTAGVVYSKKPKKQEDKKDKVETAEKKEESTTTETTQETPDQTKTLGETSTEVETEGKKEETNATETTEETLDETRPLDETSTIRRRPTASAT